MITPNAIFCDLGIFGNILSQKITITPKEQTQINVVTPKMSKNRLLGDFCQLLLNNIDLIILQTKKKLLVHYIVHAPAGHFEYQGSILATSSVHALPLHHNHRQFRAPR